VSKGLKTKPIDYGASRVERAIRFAPNPLPTLSPNNLAAYLDSFKRGYLRDTAILWNEIQWRDDRVGSDSNKRHKSIARYGYSLVAAKGQDPKSPAVKRHMDAIKFCLDNLTASDVLDSSVHGGMSTLVRQMQKAVGFQWQAHELVWRPLKDGLTVETIALPLWWFERLTGALRFLPMDLMLIGEPLEENGWMITRGDGLMAATCVLYLLKRMALTDWTLYNGRVGPGIHGKTTAAIGSEQWRNLEDAVDHFNFDLKIVTQSGVEINPIEMALKGTLPWPQMYEAMTKAITVLWRGGNLMTDGNGTPNQSGVTLQSSEALILEQDDSEMISDSLNDGIVLPLCRYRFDEEPLAWVQWRTGAEHNIKAEIEKDDALARRGWQFTVEDLSERYQRMAPQPGQTILAPPAAEANVADSRTDRMPAANEAPVTTAVADRVDTRLRAAAIDAFSKAASDDLAPIRARIKAAMDQTDDDAMLRDLAALQADLPRLLLEICKDPATQKVMEESLTAALLNGVSESAAAHQEARK